MCKNKKIFAALSTAAITALMVTAINSTAYARTTSIVITGSDNKIYEYQYDELKSSAVSQLVNGKSDIKSKLYNDFIQRKSTIKAYYDNVRKSYIKFDTIAKEAVNCAQKGTTFNLNSFTESSNNPTITLNTNTVSVDTSGNLMINGQTVSSTVDITTIKCSNPINAFSTLISFKLSAPIPDDCTIIVKGATASIDSVTGICTAYVDGKLSASDIKTSDFIITKKSLSNKPTVKSVKIVDKQTICVKFNKNVDYQYATSISNYTLLDSDDKDISNHISTIESAKGQCNTDTYNIKLHQYNPLNANEDWRLSNSKYTLLIENIVDTSSEINKMDNYSYILNNDTTAPNVTGIYRNVKTSNSKQKITVYFDKIMNTSTIINKDNYHFIDGLGDTKSLPEDASIVASCDNESVTIEFPLTYNILTNSTDITGKTSDITQLIVANVKDESENLLNTVTYKSKIFNAPLSYTCVKSNTIKTYYDKDDLKISFQFSKEIDDILSSDFTFGGITPNSVSHRGDMVTLTFKDGALATASEIAINPIIYANGKTNTNPTKIDIIKAQGQSAKLAINPTGTTDETGTLVSSILSDAQASVYDYEAAPRTTCFDNNDDNPNYWTATKDDNGGKVYITFDTPLAITSGISEDDAVFSGLDGTNIKPDKVYVDSTHPNTVVFSFNTSNKNYKAFDENINVIIKSSTRLITQKDRNGNCAVYIPSNNDLKSKLIKITT